jgi:hypothetical protein
MNAEHIDRLAQSLATSMTRRKGLLAAAGGLAATAILPRIDAARGFHAAASLDVGRTPLTSDDPPRSLAVESNATVSVFKSTIAHESSPGLSNEKTVVRFPKGGYLRVGRSQFRDDDDLHAYLAGILPTIRREGTGLRGAIKRTGKYQRVDANGAPVFTFGELVPDLITDAFGFVTVAGRRIDLRLLARTQPSSPFEGRPTPFNAPAHPSATAPFAATVAEDSVEAGGEDSRGLIPLAVATKDTIWYPNSTTRPRMQFHAWKKNLYVYWSIGAEIETWGKDFTTAKITSRYGHYELGHDVCSLVRTDSDHDSNDDYVDEYEYGYGTAGSDLLTGVWSVCEANWNSTYKKGTVVKGCTDGILL